MINELAVGLAVPAFDPRQHVRFVDPDGAGPLPSLGAAGTVSRQIKNTGDFDVTIRINRFGFRDKKSISLANPGDYVFVGDSFGFGWGVPEEQRMSNHLERQLGQNVYNIAVTGNLDGYQSLLNYSESLGAKIRKVVVGITMESDIIRYGSAQSPVKLLQSKTALPQPKSGSIKFLDVKVWLTQHSILYFMTTTLIHQTSWLKELAARAGLIAPNLDGVPQAGFNAALVESTAQRLSRIARQYELTAFLIPSRGLWHGDRKEESRKTHAMFLSRSRALGVDVVDLKPAFEKGGAPLDYHFLNDGHWNPRGHALAAQVVSAHLRRP